MLESRARYDARAQPRIWGITGDIARAPGEAHKSMPTEFDPRRRNEETERHRLRTLGLLIIILGLALVIGLVAMFQSLA
jgi:hypothetical protein